MVCHAKHLLPMLGILFGAHVSDMLAAPRVEQLGRNLYAYVSDNDHSANSTFLIGQHGILVVDTGLNAVEGQKLLNEIRKISTLPVKFIVNTHYHPDHQRGNTVVGPDAIVISSPFTRERTLQLIAQLQGMETKGNATDPAALRPTFRAASQTLAQELTIYLDSEPVEIIAPGPGHTMGDVYVFFPNQRSVAAGDLYMTRSSPAMDQGSVANWIRTLDAILALPADHFVPGHFEVGTREVFTRFRDYLADLYAQVEHLYRSGATVAQVRLQIDMQKYADFRQYPQFHATFADNAESIYHQLHDPQ
jgi:cyclase